MEKSSSLFLSKRYFYSPRKKKKNNGWNMKNHFWEGKSSSNSSFCSVPAIDFSGKILSSVVRIIHWGLDPQGFFAGFSTGFPQVGESQNPQVVALFVRGPPQEPWQVLSLGDVGFLLFFRFVSGDYGKPRCWAVFYWIVRKKHTFPPC